MRLPNSIFLKLLFVISCQQLPLLISPAYALEGDVIRPYASATYMYDDNLRRFSGKDQALASTGSEKMADTMLMTEVGIILDKKISQQVFFIDLGLNRSKFDRNSALDSNGRELNAKWNWHLGNFWQGNFQAFHKKALVPFADFLEVGGLGLNIRTEDKKSADAIWKLHPRWQTRIALVNYEVEYSAENQKAANLNENSQEVELDYISPSTSKVGVVYRHARGDRPVDQIFIGIPISNDYTQNEIKLNVDWSLSAKSKFQFLGGLVDRKHDEVSSRDFRKFNARSNFNWMPTGKTSMNLSAWRENNAQGFVTSSYTLNKGTSLSASLYATSKVTFQGNLRYEKRDFVGDDIFGSQRSDRDKTFSLGVVYKPTLSFVLNASLMHSIRESTLNTFEFDANSVSLTGQYEF
ncbi:putative exosortase B-associated extracellular polysaccharide biosynthesis transporter EpsL [Methylobacillus caricis]|uniref:XrtB/PEP-CTERM-associated polysaccharide biosynthesis outer membrane protein EpsL n=1 Tax=Methylobacillus caricis TaxID=1971611 RepID=UPI001CFFC067|nr:XrtB/PEP-CTERM-associated polysaccharide biosynthesis outer membrane protein EpsL [Methylobacillus caricis]MCB5188088.1 putative exosortase B-associated extracellular polysaccharide biosynthesis transporter EpsL [Methylobacillus caricis]